MAKSKSISRDFTEGRLSSNIVLFALPIMLTNILQVLYNLADHVVVGRFSTDTLALAAVGSTSALTSLVVNLLVGVSAGTGVAVAQSFGAKDKVAVSKTVHTSLVFAFLAGITFMTIGLLISKPALIAMGTKPELLSKATAYMRIICIGIPASAVYNFSAAALRSVGDSKTPLIILSSTGVINVIFNIIFVIAFNLSVDGVALATIIAQYISAITVVAVLIRRKGECYSLDIKKLSIDKNTLIRVLRFGVPAAIQTSLYSISNVLVASAANVFSTSDISARTITGNIDSVIYNITGSYLHATMTVTAQNYGARKLDRAKKATGICLFQVAAISWGVAQLILLVDVPIVRIFINESDPNKELILQKTCELLSLTMNTYFILGIAEALSGTLRGFGYSLTPTLLSVISICGTRITWIYTAFETERFHTLYGLSLAYPISWIISATAIGIAVSLVFKKHKAKPLHLEESNTANLA